MSNEREIMTWEIFGEASRALAQLVADDYEPDMILSIARGGLLIGGALGYALSVKNVYTMNVEFYTGVDERLEVPRILPPAPDFVDVSHARILIADDVADTGHTLRSVQDFCAGKVAEAINRKDDAAAEKMLGMGAPFGEASMKVAVALRRLRREVEPA